MHVYIQIPDAEVIGIITIEINIFFNQGTISHANPQFTNVGRLFHTEQYPRNQLEIKFHLKNVITIKESTEIASCFLWKLATVLREVINGQTRKKEGPLKAV